MKIEGVKSYVTIFPKNIDTSALTEKACDWQSEKY